MARTTREAATLLNDAAEIAYDIEVREARRLAGERPDDVGEISFHYDAAFELIELIDYAEVSEHDVRCGAEADGVVLGLMIETVRDSGACMEDMVTHLRDWARRRVSAGYERLSDSRMSGMLQLKLNVPQAS